jgi:ketosteroid isomerase-like protein
MPRRVAAITMLALAACAPRPETAEQTAARMRAESDSALAAIRAIEARYSRYVAAGMADSAALIYTDDAVVMPPNQPAITGRAAIQAAWAGIMGLGTWHLTATPTAIEANGPLAVERGTYVQEFTPGPNAPPGMAAMFPDTGKYVTIWKKVGDTWMGAWEITNSSREAPAPATRRH